MFSLFLEYLIIASNVCHHSTNTTSFVRPSILILSQQGYLMCFSIIDYSWWNEWSIDGTRHDWWFNVWRINYFSLWQMMISVDEFHSTVDWLKENKNEKYETMKWKIGRHLVGQWEVNKNKFSSAASKVSQPEFMNSFDSDLRWNFQSFE